MKKFYFLIIALFAINSAMAQGCLPEGITFTTQEQIDNFQTNYPGCTEIEGDVNIYGYESNISDLNQLIVITKIGGDLSISSCDSLINLTGLNNIKFIGGTFQIYGNASQTSLTGLGGLTSIGSSLMIEETGVLTSLTGLESLTDIGGWISIRDNNALTNLSGLDSLMSIGGSIYIASNHALLTLIALEHLTSINGGISIYDNTELHNLRGLENINSDSIFGVGITYNYSLSTCDVESICNYISLPNGNIGIYNNAPGCNSQQQILAKCKLGIDDMQFQNEFSIFPNPSSSHFTIQFTLEKDEQVKLFLMNSLGQVVATLANERLSAGQHELNWKAEEMPAGIYFYSIQIGNQAGTGKMVLMK